jgi:hypothetical protein
MVTDAVCGGPNANPMVSFAMFVWGQVNNMALLLSLRQDVRVDFFKAARTETR